MAYAHRRLRRGDGDPAGAAAPSPTVWTTELRDELQEAARKAGVWAPQAGAALGGGGFRFDEVAILLEEAGTSLLGPLALNCAAPDEGNMHLLDRSRPPEQRERTWSRWSPARSAPASR